MRITYKMWQTEKNAMQDFLPLNLTKAIFFLFLEEFYKNFFFPNHPLQKTTAYQCVNDK